MTFKEILYPVVVWTDFDPVTLLHNPGVEFIWLWESIWILLGGVCKILWTLLHSVCAKLLTVNNKLTGFSQINLAWIFARVDSQTHVKILALVITTLLSCVQSLMFITLIFLGISGIKGGSWFFIDVYYCEWNEKVD